MSISATSLPNTIGTGYDVNAADLANPAGGKSLSVLRFEQSLARADAPEAQPVAFFAPEGVYGPHTVDATPRPESFFLAQAAPADAAQAGSGGAAQAIAPSDPAITNRIGTFRSIDVPIGAAAVEAPTTGQGIIDGLSRLRGVFDAQENAITGIAPSDAAGTRLTNTSELINLQLEVVKYSMLMDVTSKLAGKSTQTFDTLMKGQ